MSVEPRITNPTDVSAATIRQILDRGARPTIQFSKPGAPPSLLRQVDNLCKEFGDALEIRFYGFYDAPFDAAILADIPNVEWLSLDCLTTIRNEDRVGDLRALKKLTFGVYQFDRPDFLNALPLAQLKILRVLENAKRNMDLSPIAGCHALSELTISGQTRNIAEIAGLDQVQKLNLGSIPKKLDLGFLSSMKGLRALELILGGRSSIDEVSHEKLEELSIIRVQGFERLGSLTRFPSLRRLQIEDQLRLINADLTGAPLQAVFAINCKNLEVLVGLSGLSALRELRIYGTKIDIEDLATRDWPPSMDVLALYSGKSKRDAQIRAVLDKRGYREFAR